MTIKYFSNNIRKQSVSLENRIDVVWGSITSYYMTVLPARDYSLGPARSKIIFWCFTPYNTGKSFIDQACSVKMAG